MPGPRYADSSNRRHRPATPPDGSGNESHTAGGLSGSLPVGLDRMNENLVQFIQHARERGMDYPTIRTLLLDAGRKDSSLPDR